MLSKIDENYKTKLTIMIKFDFKAGELREFITFILLKRTMDTTFTVRNLS
jgi:hypothetical protein